MILILAVGSEAVELLTEGIYHRQEVVEGRFPLLLALFIGRDTNPAFLQHAVQEAVQKPIMTPKNTLIGCDRCGSAEGHTGLQNIDPVEHFLILKHLLCREFACCNLCSNLHLLLIILVQTVAIV